MMIHGKKNITVQPSAQDNAYNAFTDLIVENNPIIQS